MKLDRNTSTMFLDAVETHHASDEETEKMAMCLKLHHLLRVLWSKSLLEDNVQVNAAVFAPPNKRASWPHCRASWPDAWPLVRRWVCLRTNSVRRLRPPRFGLVDRPTPG